MEGKALLFKHFAGVDGFPVCLDVSSADEIVETVRRIAPVFGGINLEDIAAPECFEVEERLKEILDIRCSTTTSTAPPWSRWRPWRTPSRSSTRRWPT